MTASPELAPIATASTRSHTNDHGDTEPMSAATLEGTQPAPGDQLADENKQAETTPSTRPQWAHSLGAVEDDLTGGSPEDQQEAGRAIIRLAVSKGEKLTGPDKLTGDTMAEHFAWSPRWWRERLREVREAANPTKLTVVTDSPAPIPAEATGTDASRGNGTAADASRATGRSGPAARANGTDGKTVARVARTQSAPVASVAPSPAPDTVPAVPPAPSERPVGTTGDAELAAAQHTARGTSSAPATRARHTDHLSSHGLTGLTGTTGTATTEAGAHTTEPALPARPGASRPAQPTRSTPTGWPEAADINEVAPRSQNVPAAAPQGHSEPTSPSSGAPGQRQHGQDLEQASAVVTGPPIRPHEFAAELALAWGAGEQRDRPRPPARAPRGPAAADTAVASPLPPTTDEPAASLPPVDRTHTAPLPRPAPTTAADPEQPSANVPAGPGLATPAEAHQTPTTPSVTHEEMASVAGAAPANGTAERPPLAVASHPVPAAEITGAAKLQYAFYGTASLFALIGQVWAALDHITIGGGWPTWLQALVMAPALAVIELAGVATSHQADLRRRLGEQAYGYRALSLMAAMVAAGVNLLGHWGEWFPAVGFTGLSVFAYCSWLMQSAARRRDALRAAGQMANTAPVFGPIQWLRQPKLTWRARLIAISEGHGRTESLQLAAQRMHRETRDKAIAKAVQKVIKTQKKDANGAIIAAATIDPDTLATALKARTDYDAWTDHLSVDLAPPARDAG